MMDPSLRYKESRRPFIGVKSSAVVIKSESVRDLLDHDKIKKIESHTGIFPPAFITPMQRIVADTDVEPVVVERVVSEKKLHDQQISLLSMQNSFKMTKEKEFKKKLDEISLLKQQLSHQKELRKDEIVRKKQKVKAMQKEMQANLSKLKQGQGLYNQTLNLKKIDLDKAGYADIIYDSEYGYNTNGINIESNERMDVTLDDYYHGINLTELRKDINIGINKPNYNIKDPVGYKNVVKATDSKDTNSLAWNARVPEIKTFASGFRVASPPSSRKSKRQDSAPSGLDSISLHSQANGSIQSCTTDYSLNIDLLTKKLMSPNNTIEYMADTPAHDIASFHDYATTSNEHDESATNTNRDFENTNEFAVNEANQVFDDSLLELSNSQITQQNSFITADALEIENIVESTATQVAPVESSVPIGPTSLTDSLDYVISTKKKKQKDMNNNTQPMMKPVGITHADPTLYITSSTTVKRGLTQPQAKTIQGRYRSGTYKPSILEITACDPFKKPFM